MGKKGGAGKGRKVNNVFKVAGARSLKMKNKAKPVAAQLKKLKEDNRQMLNKMDSEFSSLQEKIMQPNKQKAAEAARQATVFEGVRQAEAERKKKASQTQKIKEDVNKLADLMMI